METIIPLSGVYLTPYSDMCPDGQLSASAGLELHNQGLRPALLSGETITYDKQYELLCIHSTSSYTHYIFKASFNRLYWAEAGSADIKQMDIIFTKISKVNSFGNTLIVSSEVLEYILFDPITDTYRYIGSRPPELEISFGLVGKAAIEIPDKSTDPEALNKEYKIKNRTTKFNALYFDETDPNCQGISNKLMSHINKIISDELKANRFTMPFFVRAAYRMYDGTYTMLSAPVLMVPDLTGPKAFFYEQVYNMEGENVKSIYGRWGYRHVAAKLNMQISPSSTKKLEQWKDIIAGVDIFITKMIYPMDMGGEFIGLVGKTGKDSLPYSETIASPMGSTSYSTSVFDGWAVEKHRYLIAPIHDTNTRISDMVGTSQFHKAKSYTLSEYVKKSSLDRFDVFEKGDENSLQNITLQESLSDAYDFQSHDLVSCQGSMVYNDRLHIYDISRTLFSGFKAASASAYTNATDKRPVVISTYINTTDGVKIVRSTSNEIITSELPVYLYYPDPGAFKMIVSFGNEQGYEVPLTQHPFLNGSYYLDILGKRNSLARSVQPEEANAPINMHNAIYVSSAGNPFVFPLEGKHNIGAGRILGATTIATALSQGQFGQFPLLVFTSEGNYAMSVNAEGNYSTIHPVQRDVCINADSIVPTDSQILFISERGVMCTDGVNAQCLSLQLDGVVDYIPEDQDITLPDGRPVEFIKSSLIAFDYSRQRIIFFSKQNDEAYIYNISTASWSTANFPPVKTVINVYPYAYVQLLDGRLMRLDEVYNYDAALLMKGMIYTRPIKLDTYYPKIISDIRVQGLYSERQKVALYGSNDGIRWYNYANGWNVLSHIPGHSFKFIRVAVSTLLAPHENISTLRIRYKIRQNNFMR